MDEPSLDALEVVRKKALEKVVEEYGPFGAFSPEQWGRDPEAMGDVFVPRFKEHVKFTNLKSRHIRALFRAFWMMEVKQAADEGRAMDVERILAFFEAELGDINGWRANMYLRTGLEALRASAAPTQKLSYLERRRMKKQGGW